MTNSANSEAPSSGETQRLNQKQMNPIWREGRKLTFSCCPGDKHYAWKTRLIIIEWVHFHKDSEQCVGIKNVISLYNLFDFDFMFDFIFSQYISTEYHESIFTAVLHYTIMQSL